MILQGNIGQLNLIMPVQFNGKTYYFLDANNNGKSDWLDNTATYTQLDALFNNGQPVTDTANSTIVGGYKLALPTTTDLLGLIQNIQPAAIASDFQFHFQNGTGWVDFWNYATSTLTINPSIPSLELHNVVYPLLQQQVNVGVATPNYVVMEVSQVSLPANPTLSPIPVSPTVLRDMDVQTGITATDKTRVNGQAADTATLGIKGLDILNSGNASTALTAISVALNSVSSKQSSFSASMAGLDAQKSTSKSIATNLQLAIDIIQKPDIAKLQMDLQELNNRQSIDYYLISQLNSANSAALSIFK